MTASHATKYIVLADDGTGRNRGHLYATCRTRQQAERKAEEAETRLPWCVGAWVEEVANDCIHDPASVVEALDADDTAHGLLVMLRGEPIGTLPNLEPEMNRPPKPRRPPVWVLPGGRSAPTPGIISPFSRTHYPIFAAAWRKKRMSEKSPSRVQLEMQVISAVTAQTASVVTGIPRSTLRDRNAPRNEDGSYNLAVLVQWLSAAVADETTTPPNVPSPQLERWRQIRADREAFELAARRDELLPAAVINAMHERSFAILRQWASRIAGDHADVFRTYTAAVRHAIEDATRFVMRPGCKRILRIVPNDGGQPIEIDLGVATLEDVTLPPVEVQETRRCSRCNNMMSATWVIEADGSETPVWSCHTLNCMKNIPRHVEVEGAAK